MWKKAPKTGNWSATFRGISIVIRVDPKTRRPTEIEFFIGGRRVESAPVTCTLEIAKRIVIRRRRSAVSQGGHTADHQERQAIASPKT
jgi:hypothetical protein